MIRFCFFVFALMVFSTGNSYAMSCIDPPLEFKNTKEMTNIALMKAIHSEQVIRNGKTHTEHTIKVLKDIKGALPEEFKTIVFYSPCSPLTAYLQEEFIDSVYISDKGNYYLGNGYSYDLVNHFYSLDDNGKIIDRSPTLRGIYKWWILQGFLILSLGFCFLKIRDKIKS